MKLYGVGSTYVSDDDLSVTMVSQELDQLRQMAACFPVLFLGVAAVILYIMLHRLIDQQRTQIGTLMALGMKPLSVRLHYMAYGLFIGAVGGAAGGLFGNYTATPLIEYYRIFYQLPGIHMERRLDRRHFLRVGKFRLHGRHTEADALQGAAPGAAENRKTFYTGEDTGVCAALYGARHHGSEKPRKV